jgi:crotonobetainyl-CoA:carnitine CoA-transferase CaiB-like acyl-CoA transferase
VTNAGSDFVQGDRRDFGGAGGTRTTSPGTLAGIVVLDFSRIVSGPFATQVLGDLGADVIKVERLGIGDEVRGYGVGEDGRGPGATFIAMNRNKRSLALDTRTPEGREVARRLATRADVLIHNFRNGVVERLGLGYDAIKALNPGIVYCSISGFGAVGPLRESPANDLVIQAHSGLLGITGTPAGEPVRNPTPVCDITAGLYAVVGILAALRHRDRTGRGQHIETNMLEGQFNMLNYMYVDYWLNGIVPQKMGTENRMGLPNQAFATSDGWVCVIAANEETWHRCCAALDADGLATDPRFRTLADRSRHRSELTAALAAVIGGYTTQECLERLEHARVPCAPVNTLPEATEHPQFGALSDAGGIVEMEVGDLGPVKLVMSPLHLSEAPVSARLPPPRLGQHTDEVLGAVGYTADEVERLRDAGIVE